MEQLEVSSVGAAILGAVGAGIYSDVKQAVEKMVKIQRVYTPNKEIYEKYNPIFQNYVKEKRL